MLFLILGKHARHAPEKRKPQERSQNDRALQFLSEDRFLEEELRDPLALIMKKARRRISNFFCRL